MARQIGVFLFPVSLFSPGIQSSLQRPERLHIADLRSVLYDSLIVMVPLLSIETPLWV